MCGIAAILAYAPDVPPVDSAELRRIRDSMSARGPDGFGEWYSDDHRVGLGHRRLSIIDLSPAGAQPMLNHDRSLAITFNGEIYNYRELRSQLEKKGCRFQSTSDTEVLLHLYADRGEAMVNELRGMYAFALWDMKRKGLFLARDPFGIKPLYLADDGKTVRVASQVKALLAGGHIDTASDPAGHVGFFLWGHIPEPHTLYRGIKTLPAGNSLWIDRSGNKRQKAFCSITKILAEAELGNAESGKQPGEMGAPVEYGSNSTGRARLHGPGKVERKEHGQSSSEQLRFALEDSVRHHLIADVPVGVFLSAGLDSTTLTALAAHEGGTLRTVTLGFDAYRGTPNDEVPLAEQVARQYGATHQSIWVTREDFRDHLHRVFAAMDQPTTDGVNSYFVSYAAAQTSLKVALSGLGGDELFGGYPSFREIPRVVNALGWLRHCRPLGKAARIVSAPILKLLTSPKYAGLFEYGGTYAGAYLLRRGMFMPWELPAFLDPEIVRQGWLDLQPLLHLEESLEGLTKPRLKVACLESCWYMRNQLLRDSDWAGMAHSLEIRTPLVDVVLLRNLSPLLAGDLPPTKRDMALAPRSPLPDAILNRPKTGFQIPVRDWLLAQKPEARDQRPAAGRGLRSWARYVYSRFNQT
jgi:asparagine synthase (glutamine-hydrolysing)